jgi:hypothetical protein
MAAKNLTKIFEEVRKRKKAHPSHMNVFFIKHCTVLETYQMPQRMKQILHKIWLLKG